MKIFRSYQERMNLALTYIETHLDEKISLHKLAKIAFFSPYHFHRIFVGMVGEPVKTYIRRLKIQRAAMELINTNLSVTEIAFDAGYESLEAFIRSFGIFYQISPLKYRKLAKEKAQLPHILSIHKKKEITMKVMISNLPKMKIAYVRHVGPYQDCKKAWDTLIGWMAQKGLGHQQTTLLGICYDDPGVTEPNKIRYDAAIIIDEESFKPEGEVGIKEIKPKTYAMAEHIGPYENIGQTYSYICGCWAPKNNKEIDSLPSIEIYKNSPLYTPKENLITEVYLPIKN